MSNKNEKIMFRVIKGDWRSKEVLYVSEPMSFGDCMEKEKELVPGLAPSGSKESVLVKIYGDHGEDFDYMCHGGWMIFTHKEHVPW